MPSDIATITIAAIMMMTIHRVMDQSDSISATNTELNMANDPTSQKEKSDAILSKLEVRGWIYGLIVAFGVAGEAYYGVKILSNSRVLRYAQKQLDIQAINETNTIKERLTAATTRAAEATRLAGESNQRAAEANQSAAEANERAEKERIERLKLEKMIAPRTLSQIQLNAIRLAIQSDRPRHIECCIVGQSGEILAFGQSIREEIRLGGWTINEPFTLGMSCTGVVVGTGTVNAETQKTAEQLCTALLAAGLIVIREVNCTVLDNNIVRLSIGAIPPNGQFAQDQPPGTPQLFTIDFKSRKILEAR